jgi:hypothetical protein
MTRRLGALLALAVGCSADAPPSSSASALPPGVLARVGAEEIVADTVRRVAERQGLSASVANQLAISDAILAHGARARLPAGSVHSVERAASARALLDALAAELSAGPPPTEPELDELVRERWVELARPEAVRTTHAVVVNDKPERAAAARAVATKLAAALASVSSSDELIRIAQAFPGEGFEIRAQALPFVTADGRVFQRTDVGFAAAGRFDEGFARAANALTELSHVGPVAESSFGFHVMLLEERLPSAETPRAELAGLLGTDVRLRRGIKLRKSMVEKLRSTASIQIERAADDLMARVKTEP